LVHYIIVVVCEEQAEKGATISPILIQLLLQKKINVAQIKLCRW